MEGIRFAFFLNFMLPEFLQSCHVVEVHVVAIHTCTATPVARNLLFSSVVLLHLCTFVHIIIEETLS